MGDLSTHFSRKEFACRCGCGFDTADHELVKVLENVRVHFQKCVRISGPNRCVRHNQAQDGAKNSQHIYAKAADIKVSGVSPEDVYDYLDRKYPNTYGLGIYANRVHVDVRPERARWDTR